MTGLWPPRHGVHTNGADTLASEAETLAEILKRHGYTTAAVIGAFVLERQFGLGQGFDHYDDRMPDGSETRDFSYAERNAQLVTDAALSRLEQTRHEPLLLWVHYFDPHFPYEPPEFDPAFSHRHAYDAEVSFVDNQMKRLLSAFDEQSDGETLVILTADHGEALGAHGEPTHGLFTYDGTLRVPMIVRFPDQRHEGTVVSIPVSLVDVVPSILEWMNIPGTSMLDGIPLPLGEPSRTSERPIHFENRHVTEVYGWSSLVGVIAGHNKFIQAPQPELYNLRDDPYEQTNLFERLPDQSEQMAQQLDEVTAQLRERGTLHGTPIDATHQTLAKLRALGYVGGSPLPIGDACAVGPDPKDMVDVFVRIKMAMSLLEEDRVSEAADIFVDILNIGDPKNRRVMELLATFIPKEEQVRQRAISCLQAIANRADERMPPIFVVAKLGKALVEDERFNEAIEAFERMLHIEPGSAVAHWYLGQANERLGQPMVAISSYQRAIELLEQQDEPPDWIDDARRQLALLKKDATEK